MVYISSNYVTSSSRGVRRQATNFFINCPSFLSQLICNGRPHGVVASVAEKLILSAGSQYMREGFFLCAARMTTQGGTGTPPRNSPHSSNIRRHLEGCCPFTRRHGLLIIHPSIHLCAFLVHGYTNTSERHVCPFFKITFTKHFTHFFYFQCNINLKFCTSQSDFFVTVS
uniref:Uncharacterized protein n=1 Tax=Cacopsylla melanoneura TaxID=428564 RepID=A0A8D8UHG0_9HEMI